jgi:myosin-crossreactive antigen
MRGGCGRFPSGALRAPFVQRKITLPWFRFPAKNLQQKFFRKPPKPPGGGRSVALWRRLAQGRTNFGNPDVYFDPAKSADSRWVTFTVTTTGTEFIDEITALTGSKPGTGGLVTLRDSGWLLSLTIFHNPEVLGQPQGTNVCGATAFIRTATAISSRNP